jgi:hypothetical protein
MRGSSAGICAIAKDEGPYLVEWAVYHHLLGFDPILVYNHDSTDDSAELLALLEDRGIAEGVEWAVKPNQRPQKRAFAAGHERLRGQVDWIAFIDIDEFVVLPRHDDIGAFLGDYDHMDAIAVNWKMLGSSGHREYEPGLVMERFTGCATREFDGNRAIKAIARPEGFTAPRPHTCDFNESVTYMTVAGEAIPAGEGRSEQVTHDPIRLNHYFTKSWEEWEWKMKRGRGGQRLDSPKKYRTEQEFAPHDRNEETERDIQERAPEVKRMIDSLRLPSPSV